MTEEKENKEIEKSITYKYGIPVDAFSITSGKVKKNENLSTLFSGYNVPDKVIHQIPRISGGIFNSRKIKAGAHYTIFSPYMNTQSISYFVYERIYYY